MPQVYDDGSITISSWQVSQQFSLDDVPRWGYVVECTACGDRRVLVTENWVAEGQHLERFAREKAGHKDDCTQAAQA